MLFWSIIDELMSSWATYYECSQLFLYHPTINFLCQMFFWSIIDELISSWATYYECSQFLDHPTINFLCQMFFWSIIDDYDELMSSWAHSL